MKAKPWKALSPDSFTKSSTKSLEQRTPVLLRLFQSRTRKALKKKKEQGKLLSNAYE